MSVKVSPYLGGLGLDATGVFEVQSNSTVTVGGGSGNVVVGKVEATTLSATNFEGLSSNAIEDSDSVVSITDPAITLASNGTDRLVVDSSQTKDVQVTGNFGVDGTFDLGALS